MHHVLTKQTCTLSRQFLNITTVAPALNS